MPFPIKPLQLKGICAGHLYYFLEDVFPNQPNGFRFLETPAALKWLFDTPAPMPHVEVSDRPGGLSWGAEDGAEQERNNLAEEDNDQQQQQPDDGGANDANRNGDN